MYNDHDPRLRDLNVLVVDDDASTRAIVRELLRAMGFDHIETAGDGRAALRRFAERMRADADIPPFELIVCDWQMPEMSGLDLLKMVRRRFPLMPFVMLTAMRGIDDVRSAMEAGVSAYVLKPIVPAELTRKVRGVLLPTEHHV